MPFRAPELVDNLRRALRAAMPAGRRYKIMHVCGSHEQTISRWGLRSMLPESLEVVAGPGCPVCVCPEHEVGEAIEVARRGAIVASFGDMLSLPSRHGSLAQAKAEGGDVRIVYGPLDALRLARRHPDRQVVLFAVGFETTAAPVALLAVGELPENFSLLVAHRLTPPAMELLLGIGDVHIAGFIAPGHVSTIVGADAWRIFPEAYHMPVVVAGFEPEDVLLGLLMIVKQLERGEARLENEYGRVAPIAANRPALAALEQVFEVIPAWWRGIGRIPRSGLRLRSRLARWDARLRFDLHLEPDRQDLPPGCSCHLVMLGKIYPPACPLFRERCAPLSPAGPCMVSREGTCFIWHTYKGDGR